MCKKCIIVFTLILSTIFSSVLIIPNHTQASYLSEKTQSIYVYAGEDFSAVLGVKVKLDADVRIGNLPCRPEVATRWSVVSGNADFVSFTNSSFIDTDVTFTRSGSYTLRLSASYLDQNVYDDVNVEVYSVRPAPPAENEAPIIDIGEGEKIYVPSYPGTYHFKNASVADDGFPIYPGVVTVLWEAASYPYGATVSFDDSSIINTTATFSTLGLYRLKVTAFDGEKSSYAYVDVEVYYVRPVPGPENKSPIVDIGEDDTISISSKPGYYYFESASATDDGLPNPPGSLSIEWSVISSPIGGSVDFVTSPKEINTEVVFDKVGRYIMKLRANDGEKTSFDTITINVIEVRPVPGPGNSTPYVDIGEERIILISSNPGTYKFVNAWVIDDGNPNPPGRLEINWSLVKSNIGGEVEFLEGEGEVNVTAKFSKPDTYLLRLAVFDGEESYSDEVTVKVIYVRPAPGTEDVEDELIKINDTQILIDDMINLVRILLISLF